MKKANKIDALKKLKAFVKSDRFGRDWATKCTGLCSSVDELFANKEISSDQSDFILSIIYQKDRQMNRSKDRGWYLWKEGAKSPRIKFINEQLKRLEKK